MRSELEMMHLILTFAQEHEDIRAVLLNGSRANPNAKRDPFQDYDILCLVRSVEPYRRNPEIPHYFGELLMMETPEDMDDPPPENDGRYGYLMQFMDGNRIDLGFSPLEKADQEVNDSLTVVLMDKDNRFGQLPPSSDRDYLPKKPTPKAYEDCCTEFWWLNSYVAKGLWRDELTYAQTMQDNLRGEMLRMLTWYFGIQTGFQKSPGKLGKYLKGSLPGELWAMLERTYSDAQPEHMWESLFTIGDLFRIAAQAVARSFGFTYPEQDDINVSSFIRRIRALPRNAKTL